jgi:hypothetical protein
MKHRNCVTDITDDRILFEAQELLDGYEARLHEVTTAQYFATKTAVIQYVAGRLADDPDWNFNGMPGAVEDIIHDVRRSMETQALLEGGNFSKDQLLTDIYLRMLPAANKLAA